MQNVQQVVGKTEGGSAKAARTIAREPYPFTLAHVPCIRSTCRAVEMPKVTSREDFTAIQATPRSPLSAAGCRPSRAGIP